MPSPHVMSCTPRSYTSEAATIFPRPDHSQNNGDAAANSAGTINFKNVRQGDMQGSFVIRLRVLDQRLLWLTSRHPPKLIQRSVVMPRLIHLSIAIVHDPGFEASALWAQHSTRTYELSAGLAYLKLD